METPVFKKELAFFIANQQDLVSKHVGKFLLIKDDKVLAVKDSFSDAYFFGVDNYGLGNFMIQRCIPGEEAYTTRIATLAYAQ